MMMVQKPVHLLSSPQALMHRRLPSAPPAVLVQPTRTPGLLTLSKPAQPVAPRRQQPHRAPRGAQKDKSKLATTAPRPAPVSFPAAEHAKETTVTKEATAPSKDIAAEPKPKSTTPASNDKDKSPRGRQRAKPSKEKANARSSSHSAVPINARRRQPHHQGSPPQPSTIAVQAEARSKKTNARSRSNNANHNLFDPFLNHGSDSDSDRARATPPPADKAPASPSSDLKLTSRPTGKLARRRQALSELPDSPSPSRAVAVPRGKTQARDNSGLSRSAPGQVSQPLFKENHSFPICDDMTDVDDDDVAPLTPTREVVTWQQQDLLGSGPRTAPLSSTFTGMPFFPCPTTPTPQQRRNRPSHMRSPSEGIFNLSFEEDKSSSAGSEELKALVGLLPRRRIQSASSTPTSIAKAGRKQQPANFFASSTFQNSPSPDDLPAPLF